MKAKFTCTIPEVYVFLVALLLPNGVIISDYQNLPFLTASLNIIGSAENINGGLTIPLLIFAYTDRAKITCPSALTKWRLQ